MRKCIFRVTNIVEVTYNATTLTERIPLVDRVNDSFPSGFVFCIWLLLLLLVTRRPNSMETMEDIAFGDWPGQPMDLAGSNPWLPAYGYQPPTTLLEKEDFLGHPDADLFLHGSASQHYVYLETIQEETSDDLRSESDISESRAASPVGWLATDSETGSVIRIHTLGTYDSSSEREIACPSKRRKQDTNLLCVSDDESSQSLSRSSSLIQFESLEKQCQDISSSSPSIFSSFSYDSLENQNKNISPDSLEKSYNSEPESDYYKTLKIDASIATKRGNYARSSESDSGDTTESEDTLETAKYGSCKSVNNLKTWRSFDGLHANNNVLRTNKVSVENLSEDSGYSDHFCQYNKNKSSSIPNIAMALRNDKLDVKFNSSNNNNYLEKYRLKNCKNFDAYDGDIYQNFTGNFGVSYQDLSTLEKYNFADSQSHLLEQFPTAVTNKNVLNLDGGLAECETTTATTTPSSSTAKYKQETSSEPNLLSANQTAELNGANHNHISSVPKDLNLIGAVKCEQRNSWPFITDGGEKSSIATKNFDLTRLNEEIIEETRMERRKYRKKSDRIGLSLKVKNQRATPSSDTSSSDLNDVHYKREGSYLEAMENMVNMSDDENNPCYRDKTNRSTIVEFDKKILKAISEQSIQAISLASLGSVKDTLDILFMQPISSQNRSVKSTPNLSVEEDKPVFPRKSSLINRTSLASTSSENEDKTLTASTKSMNGSLSSKGVHFCPVVAEVNWRDSASTDRASSCSLSSTPSPKLIRPEPRLPERGMSVSQPELQMVQTHEPETVKLNESDTEYTFVPLTPRHSISQPNVTTTTRRRNSQENSKLCKSLGNETFYVDKDGIGYKHTHLGPAYKKAPSSLPTTSPPASNTVNSNSSASSSIGHVVASGNQKEVCGRPAQPKQSVSAMESQLKRRDSTKSSKSGKLGGFFSRIASFRFTKSKQHDDKLEKNKNKKKTTDEVKNFQNSTGLRLATKEDYIYIPLKGPANDTAADDNNACISGKPPLPKMPPRVVGASVKRRNETPASPATPAARNIDSGDSLPQPMEPMGLIETDLDTEVTVITSGAHVKTRSLMNLGADGAPPRSLTAPQSQLPNQRPHKSMEFLLDKQNLKVVEPPENELQKGERVMSEHQLRVQRSLQKLTVPEWYKQSEVPREGFLLKKSPVRDTSRWTGTNSKTTSLNSLGSSTQSPLVLSPIPQNQPFVRWSTSKLNSTASSPCASTRSSFNARQPNGSISPSSLRSSFNYRQPYLGWRSQERLSRPRTPAERLANTILNHSNHHQQESPEIQTSIKEVTSAIVHYVSGLKPEDHNDREDRSQRSRSVSPRGSQKLCWLESSFVGTRPLDSPQTPVTLSESQTSTPVPPSTLRLDLQTHNDFTSMLLNARDTARPSPGSTTLEDVLDSLLGLPSSTRAPSPSLQETVSANTSPVRDGESRLSDQFRRSSEGNEPPTRPSSVTRRVSFSSSPVLRCRYSRCGKIAIASTAEGQAFKNCHNCTYTYCSRACRRAHWEKHRKSCLFSRVGSLCRQVIASAKEKPETLHHLSVIARRGYLSHGLGAVKCFFPTPEAAEKFLTGGLENLGELTYICWKDLLPSEMGSQLYTELVKMCKHYNPDSKLVVYVSVCVVSEAPAAGAVKWERQLVSRCAKMRLSKDIRIPERDTEAPETLILTSEPIKLDPVNRYREISFGNIQRHLRQRGVSLRRHYPEVFQQLQTYVEGQCDKFKAVTVYPRDTVTGKTFICIIMPESEPENLQKVIRAGVKVRTIDILKD